MAMAANLESMGKSDEALAAYQQIATSYANSFNAPLALLSQVYILKGKNKNDEARRICETILTQYRTSFWAGEAMQELRLLKPSSTPVPVVPPGATVPPFLAPPATSTGPARRTVAKQAVELIGRLNYVRAVFGRQGPPAPPH